MTLEHLGIATGILTGLVSLISVAYLAGGKIARMEVKVDALWAFLMRRAGVEAVNQGIATINSPMKITPKGRDFYITPLKEDLIAFYKTFKQPITDRKLTWEIELAFGPRIVTEICSVHGVSLGSCLLAAAAVAKECDTVEIEDEPTPCVRKP